MKKTKSTATPMTVPADQGVPPARALESVRIALSMSDAPLLSSVSRDIDWGGFTGGELAGLVTFATGSPMANQPNRPAEDTVLAFLDAGVEAGQLAVFETRDSEAFPQKFVEPVDRLIEYGMTRALLRYVQNGFDPTVPRGRHGLNAIAYAQARMKPEIADMLRACSARRAVDDALSGASAGERPCP